MPTSAAGLAVKPHEMYLWQDPKQDGRLIPSSVVVEQFLVDDHPGDDSLRGRDHDLMGGQREAVAARRSRDPLKNILARAMLARHFYLPAMAGLRDQFTAGRELSADDAAVTAYGIARSPGRC